MGRRKRASAGRFHLQSSNPNRSTRLITVELPKVREDEPLMFETRLIHRDQSTLKVIETKTRAAAISAHIALEDEYKLQKEEMK